MGLVNVGDRVQISDFPASRNTVDSYKGKTAVILEIVGDQAFVQVEGLGRAGQRWVLLEDLAVVGQMKMEGF